jgi:ABC-type polysaccharide/polyol phosphate export permease
VKGSLFIINYCRNVHRSRYILLSLVQKDLKNKYRKSLLGVAWSILTPLGMVLIIGSVYSVIWGQDPKVFIPILFTGLTPWLFLTGSAEGGAMCFAAAEGYIKQTMTNIEIFPIRSALIAFVNLLYSSAAFFVVYLFLAPQKYSLNMLMVLPGLVILFTFGAGIATIAGVINTHIRDYQPLQSLILQGMFYATPIIYPKELLANKGFSLIYLLNPFYYMIEVVRTPMTGGVLPSVEIYVTAIAISLSVALIGIYIIRKVGRSLVFRL